MEYYRTEMLTFLFCCLWQLILRLTLFRPNHFIHSDLAKICISCSIIIKYFTGWNTVHISAIDYAVVDYKRSYHSNYIFSSSNCSPHHWRMSLTIHLYSLVSIWINFSVVIDSTYTTGTLLAARGRAILWF